MLSWLYGTKLNIRHMRRDGCAMQTFDDNVSFLPVEVPEDAIDSGHDIRDEDDLVDIRSYEWCEQRSGIARSVKGSEVLKGQRLATWFAGVGGAW